jgi:SprT-like family
MFYETNFRADEPQILELSSSRFQNMRFDQNPRLNSPDISESSADDCGDQELDIERSLSRVSISSKAESRSCRNIRPISDKGAAMEMERCFRRRVNRRHDHLTSRILHDLINRRATLSDDSLDNLLHAADKIFFDGKLSGRVRWKWSEPDQKCYETELLGTTAIRNAHHTVGGFETLVVLSEPLLRRGPYDRDLLLSAFLHELVHCYLFIRCGINHAMHDGHTEGFQKIARLINNWIGNHRLHLCHMRANLNLFQNRDVDVAVVGRRECNGRNTENEAYVPVQDVDCMQEYRRGYSGVAGARKLKNACSYSR